MGNYPFYTDYSILKASSAIPFVCRPYDVDGVPYYDGALDDPVPVEKAFQPGCDKVVVILSRPKDRAALEFAACIKRNTEEVLIRLPPYFVAVPQWSRRHETQRSFRARIKCPDPGRSDQRRCRY